MTFIVPSEEVINLADLHILRIKPYIMGLNNDACNACGTVLGIM